MTHIQQDVIAAGDEISGPENACPQTDNASVVRQTAYHNQGGGK